jgi:hypothetical protein
VTEFAAIDLHQDESYTAAYQIQENSR